MKTYIALIRGINVGGHKKVPMATLKQILNGTVLKEVKTYIQSGNIIFKTQVQNKSTLEEIIKTAIALSFGFLVPVIVKTREELQLIFDASIFSEAKKVKSYFILLNKIPESNLVKEVHEITFENESFYIVNNCLYFYSSTGYGRTKFNLKTFEKN